jgi:hypothetical protein
MQSRLIVAHQDEVVAMHTADIARAVAVGLIMANNARQASEPPPSHPAQPAGQIARFAVLARRDTASIAHGARSGCIGARRG